MTEPLVALRIAPDMTAAVDRLAAEQGTSRSAVIRQAIAQLIDQTVMQLANQTKTEQDRVA